MNQHELGAMILRDYCKNEPDITERLKKAMRAARNPGILWFAMDDDIMFRSALGGAMLESSPEDQELIKRSLLPLKALSAAISGVPVDMGAALEGAETMLPLLKLWNETKEAKAA